MHGTRERIQLPSGHSFRVLRWASDVGDVEMVVGPGRTIPVKGEGAHWHYHVAMELTLFTAGEGTRFVGDQISPFAPGDLVLLGENLPHHWHTRGQSAGLSVQWEFPHGHPFWTFPEALTLAPLFKSAVRGLHYSGPAAEALRAGLQELTLTTGADQLGLLFRLLARMASAPEKERKLLSTPAFALPAGSEHRQAMAEAVRYLLANFRDEVRLEEVLKLTRMSKPTFSRQFKQHSGKTFCDFVSQIRLQTACRELIETSRSILDIALSSGFSQVSFFNRIFRRTYRCSPTEFRAREQGRGQRQSTVTQSKAPPKPALQPAG